MRLNFLLPACPLLLAGCMGPLFDRLDEANAHAAKINEQMDIATAKLQESKAILERAETKMDEANQTLRRVEIHINDMNQKFTTLDQGFRKLFNIKEEEDTQLFDKGPFPWAEQARLEQP